MTPNEILLHKIKQAVEEKKSKEKYQEINHGLDPEYFKNHITENKKFSKAKANKQIISTRQSLKHRPPKAFRISKNKNDLISLLNTPVATSIIASEYPSPTWFKSNTKTDVSVIIPMYKSHYVISDLINSWKINTKDLTVESIYIDDNCPNNCKDIVLREWKKRVKKLRSPIGKIYYNEFNVGYGPSCNIGAEKSTGDYLIFLNADTEVTHGWIESIVELLKNPTVGIVGNLHIKKGGMWDNTIDSAGSEWRWDSMCFSHLGRNSYNRNNIPVPFTVENAPKNLLQTDEREMVTGCCFGIRKDLFEEIGGFDPNYRIGYWEDSDICLKVREKGYKVLFQPNSVIYHKLSHSNSGSHIYTEHNKKYFFNKWITSGRIDNLVNDPRPFIMPKVKSILLQRTGGLGDTLVAAAIAPALKKRYPNSKIYFRTNETDLLKNNPYIYKAIKKTQQISERNYNLFLNLDLCYENRPTQNILTAFCEASGLNKKDSKLFIDTKEITGLPQKYVVIHAGKTLWVGRNWRKDYFSNIAVKLKDSGKKVICIGTKTDHDVPCDLDFRGKTDFQELAYLIKESELFVGIDSFPLHIAQAFNKKGVCFFGSIDPKIRIFSKNIVPIQAKNLDCLGCHHRKPKPCLFTKNCETGGEECIESVSVDQMWNKIKDLI